MGLEQLGQRTKRVEISSRMSMTSRAAARLSTASPGMEMIVRSV